MSAAAVTRKMTAATIVFASGVKPRQIPMFTSASSPTYPSTVAVDDPNSLVTRVTIPADAQPGQALSILQATNDGKFPQARYARIIVHIA